MVDVQRPPIIGIILIEEQILHKSGLSFSFLQIKRINGLSLPGSSSGQEPGKVRDVRNTQISLAIAGVFLVCHSVRWIPNIWELQQTRTEQVSANVSFIYSSVPLMRCYSVFLEGIRGNYF